MSETEEEDSDDDKKKKISLSNLSKALNKIYADDFELILKKNKKKKTGTLSCIGN